MKALSLIQPWASLVAIGAKKIETRSWKTPYRGTLAIHASKGFPQEARRLCAMQEPFRSVLMKAGFNVTGPNKANFMPLGVILAVCELDRILEITRTQTNDVPLLRIASDEFRIVVKEPERSFGDYTTGRFGWLLKNVRALKEPIVCKGALGLWDVPANVESLIREQLQNG